MRVLVTVFCLFVVCTLFITSTRAQSAPPEQLASQTPAQPVQLTQPQTPEQIVASLEKHTVVLRSFYADASLTFDSQGKLISAGTPGFGPTDGRIYVEKAEIKDGAIVLSGVRPGLIWHTQTSDFQMTNTGLAVDVQIGLDPSALGAQSVTTVLNRVFLKHSELQQIQCSADDVRIHGEILGAGSKDKTSIPESLGEIKMNCFPGGERAYRVGRGITPPKPIYTPDPHYTREAQEKKYQGNTILGLIVDASGKPTTIIVTRALGMGLDEQALAAVSSWKFSPATFQGKPVPVGINVVVNFKLY